MSRVPSHDPPRSNDASRRADPVPHRDSPEHFRQRELHCRYMAEVTNEPLRGIYLDYAERYSAAAGDARSEGPPEAS